MQVKNRVLSSPVTVFVLVLAGFLLLPALDFGLWEPWEPKYAQAVVEMEERGDYLTPFYRGDPRFSKPILTYWVIALSYACFGVGEFATRLPFALFAVASIGVLVHSLSRLFSRTLGCLAGVILLTSPMFYLLGRQAVPDALFVANLTIAMCFLALGLFEEESRRRRMFLFYVFSGLAVLSKGPLALVIIVTVVGLYAVLTLDFTAGSLRRTLKGLGNLLFSKMKLGWGVPLFLVIAVPWYAYNFYHYDLLLERLKFDYLERFSRAEGDHGGGIGFYLEALFYGFFPWCALIPAALLWLNPRRKRKWEDPEKKHLFFLCWLICPLLMFSAAQTKFTYYVSPVLPPLAFLGALYLTAYLKDKGRPATFFALFIVALGVFLLPARELLEDPKYLLGSVTIKRSVGSVVRAVPVVPDPHKLYLVLLGSFGVILLMSAVLSYGRMRKYAVVGLCAVAFLFSVYNAQDLVLKLTPHKTQKYAIQNVKEMMEPEDKLAIFFPGKDNYQRLEWSAIEASAIFYTNNDIVELNSNKQAERFFTTTNGTYCIVRRTHMSRLKRILKKLDLRMKVVDTSHFRFRTITVKEESSAISSAATQ